MFTIILLISLIAVAFAQIELAARQCTEPEAEGYACGAAGAQAVVQWYYNLQLQECVQFNYYGCGGNGNRFGTRQDCWLSCATLAQCVKGQPLLDVYGSYARCSPFAPCPADYRCVDDKLRPTNTLCCPRPGKICESAVDGGQYCGISTSIRYYYDRSVNLCREFTFAGCGGNQNNFNSKGQCLQFCAAGVTCLVGEPLNDGTPNRLRACDHQNKCPPNYTCITREGGQKVCCPSRDHVCSQATDRGTQCSKKRASKRWSFDVATGQCSTFQYEGCGGNLNMFIAVEQCTEYCLGSCSFGSEPHLNTYTGQPQLCDPLSALSTCPVGYECVSTSVRAAICCTAQTRCPHSESSMLQDATQPTGGGLSSFVPVHCVPERNHSCPNNYKCVQAPNKEYVCCTAPVQCPFGMETLRGGDRMEPRYCTAGVQGNCPRDYVCTQSTQTNTQVCCRPLQLCLMPHLHPDTNEPQSCTPGHGQCAKDTYCLPLPEPSVNAPKQPASMTYFCCLDVKYEQCEDGSVPFLDPGSTRPRLCHLADPRACPDTFGCERFKDGSYGCCAHRDRDSANASGHVVRRPCAMARINYNTSLPFSCTNWLDTDCPSGTRCQLSTDTNFYCCDQLPQNAVKSANGKGLDPLIPEVDTFLAPIDDTLAP